MRYFIILLLLFTTRQLKATNYYFSTSNGDDSRSNLQAQHTATPWKTLAKLNAIFASLSPGDSVLFKRGEIFEGSIIVSRSGNVNQPIVFAAFGEGEKPVIMGLTKLNNWTSAGSNIWQTDINISTKLNLLLVNGEATAMGRFPNGNATGKGYLYYEHANGNSQITDNELTGSPDWTGGEVVIRKNRWVLDRNPITGHSGNTINYNTASSNYPSDRFGYFIQNHPKTLDQHGEWFHNVQQKKVGVFLSSGNPEAANIQAGIVDILVLINNRQDILFTGLRFSGANQSAFALNGSQRISIINCDITYSGLNAITAGNTGYLFIEKNLIDQTFNIAIDGETCSNLTIRENKISNTGMKEGMGNDNSGSYEAVMLTGDNHLIEGNQIENTGYIPITFRGNTNIIRNNFINLFSVVKDDGSGIYTWNNIPGAPLSYGSKISGNIILNGKGAGEGTDNIAYKAANGIYIDDNSANIEITGNTAANMALHGIYIHNAHDLTITNNTLFNNGSQVALVRDNYAPQSPVRNVTMQQNIFFSNEATQPTAEFRTHENDIQQFGNFDNNYYARPVNDNFTISASYTSNGGNVSKAINLADWKRLYGKDDASQPSPSGVTSPDQVLFHYNATAQQQTIALDKIYIDVKNNTYTANIRLDPFTSVILLPKTNAAPGNDLCPSTGGILHEQWNNVSGNDIDDIPLSIKPNSSTTLSRLETVQLGDNYASRITGYICPPLTGNYTFFISGDDAVELWLSTDENPANKKKIAGILSYTEYNEWNKFPGQTSAKISLRSGQRYYIEVLHKEGAGGDHVSVGWQLPDDKKEMPIPGNRLSPFSAGDSQPPVTPDPSPGNDATCTSTGTILRELWLNAGGNNISDIPVNNPPSSISAFQGLYSADIGDEYGERLRGYVCPPQTGNYSFFIAADDAAEVWLSSDELPAGKRKIAYLLSYTNPNEFTKHSSQLSGPVLLQAGRKYYIEILHKEGGGGDHLIVGWQLPDGRRETPVPGNRLSPYIVISLPTDDQCVAEGSVLLEQWLNTGGIAVSDIPLNRVPDKVEPLSRLQTYDRGDRYGIRLRGYVCAPFDGDYKFSVAGDDAVELWLSTDEDPVNKNRIVQVTSYTAFQDWYTSASQTSAPITLKAGKRYYIEVLQKEGEGGDHLSIGWQLPGNRSEFPIGENRLSPYLASNSVYTSNIRRGQVVNEVPEISYNELAVYPNPFTTNASIIVHLQKPGITKLEVYDVRGRFVKTLFSGWLDGGAARKFSLEPAQLTNGVYFIRMTTKAKVINQKITYSR